MYCVVVSNSILFRRTHGGRKLWESKDDRKWGHDKFEEMTSQERHYDEVNFTYMSYLHEECNSFSVFFCFKKPAF